MNQSIEAKKIQKFCIKVGVVDIHHYHNKIPLNQLDSTEINGSKPIDTIAASTGIIEYVKGYKLIGSNDIVQSDHCAYIVDVNFEEYFQEQLSLSDKINKVMLKPSRRSYGRNLENIQKSNYK